MRNEHMPIRLCDPLRAVCVGAVRCVAFLILLGGGVRLLCAVHQSVNVAAQNDYAEQLLMGAAVGDEPLWSRALDRGAGSGSRN